MRGTPPAGALGDRALDAMAKAARRARLAEQGPTTAVDERTDPNVDRHAGTAGHRDLNEDDAPTPVERPAARSLRNGAEPSMASPAANLRSPRRRVPPRGVEDVLRVCVLVTAGLVVVLGALAFGFGLSGDRDASPAATHAVVVPRSNSPEVKRSGASQKNSAGKVGVAQQDSGRSGGPTSSVTGPATATPPAPNPSPPGPSPVLSAVTPDAGDAGQVVMVNGSNLFSPDENIQASFGGQPADISCPSQALCMMTVPLLAASAGTISITVTTEAGTSDVIPFTYGLATTSSCGQCQFGGPHHRPSGLRPPGSH
jgi:hypothetical protein